MRGLTFTLCWLLTGAVVADEPLRVTLVPSTSTGSSRVLVGHVAHVTGGDPAKRSRVARLDLDQIKNSESQVVISRRQLEFRLRLAGFDPAEVTVLGPDKGNCTLRKRAITADEVVSAAREEWRKRLGTDGADLAMESVVPLSVKLPELGVDDPVVITARPHTRVAGTGRMQMDVTITAEGENLLSLAVLLEARPGAVRTVNHVAPQESPRPATPGPIVVKARQRVTMSVKAGSLVVSATGEAQQDGRVGQTIPVQNVDSKKLVSARVSGPGTVEIDMGGTP